VSGRHFPEAGVGYEYQLVLQLPEECPLASLDIEDDIAEALGNPRDSKSLPHFVDGNSIGGGTIEFFIHTNDPLAAFELTKPLLMGHGLIEFITAAYRRFSEDDYSVIWPVGYGGDFKV
jgi:hypothetical protein